MPRIPVRIGQENRVKVLTAFGGRDIPLLAVNATNLVGGIATASRLQVNGDSKFVGLATFTENIHVQEIAFLSNLYVSGITTFTIADGKENGIPYFGSGGILQVTDSPSVGIQTSNLFLTTNESNVPVWTGTIDGGTF
jgi:hypothetical protein